MINSLHVYQWCMLRPFPPAGIKEVINQDNHCIIMLCLCVYRYIPVGLLERVPQKINQRPPYYRGRDDLETLMASNNCQDWIKLSEMLLGPAPDNFSFLPKHRANAYD